jgi:hypothetical protein
MVWSPTSTLAGKAAAIAVVIAGTALGAQQAPAPAACTISGTITGLGGPLPGVSITVRRDDMVRSASSTDIDGTFKLTLPEASYQLTAELTGFVQIQNDVTVSRQERREGVPAERAACAQTVELTMTLTPRAVTPRAATATPANERGFGRAGRRAGGPPAASETAEAAAQRRFESLTVTENVATRSLDPNVFESAAADPSTVIAAGFGSEALADAFAVTGEATRVDRGVLNDRRDAIARGDLLPPDFDPRNVPGGFAGLEGAAATFQGRGGREGGNPNFQGRGGAGGPVPPPDGRGGNPNFRGGQRSQGTANYRFSGSPLNSAPQQLRSEVRGVEPRNANHNYSFTTQIPLKIPGIYSNPNNRTMLRVSYSGSTGTTPFDQYATVPTDAMRRGDFSSASTPLIDPLTGQPFAGNQIPADRISPQAQALLQYYPAATLTGTTRNYHRATTTYSRQNQVQLRFQHNFTGQGGRGGRGGGPPGGFGRAAGQGNAGRGGARTNVNMNLNFQYQQSDNDQLNVFSALGGARATRNYSISNQFNIQRARNQFRLSANYSHSSSGSINNFSGIDNVSNAIGIGGVSDSPFAWGLPRLSFSSITGLSDVNPSRSIGDRVGTNVNWSRPFGRHQIQAGGVFNYDQATTNNESNANGSFVFTGIYTANGGALGGLTGFDFADFLLGMPQQATIAYGPGETTLTGRDLGFFFQDQWRLRGNLTLNLGVRWDLRYPFVEENGRLVNLDVNSDFSAAAPVLSGDEGAFTGSFPRALIDKDINNVSPRLAAAWRGPAQFQFRGSWEIQYNDSTYSGIARRLAQQPPFATTGTNIGGLSRALLMESALTGININETRNDYGIERDYVVGTANQAVVGVQRSLFRTFQIAAQYGHTIGSNLEIVRAPNRDADGLRIEGVQPFTWTTSEGRSVLDSASVNLRKNESRGLGYQVEYAFARSRDNSPSIGGGGGTGNVAQDDQNIDAEWARSSFEQRHRLTLSANYRFPFGPTERWLSGGGLFAGIAGGWRVSANFSANSGRPQTVTVSGASRDIASGINGALRADYTGESVSIANPSIDQWFNTAAFSVPAAGEFGSSPRNIIIGPGSKNLNMNVNRQVRLGGNRNLQIQMQVSNLLNLANYSGVDTNVNSPTFGQIRSVTGQRRATLNLRFGF